MAGVVNCAVGVCHRVFIVLVSWLVAGIVRNN